MTKYEVDVRIPGSAGEVIKILATPEYAEWEALNEGAVSAKARVKSQDGGRTVIVIDRVDYSRGAGGKKTFKTERNVITQQWDAEAMRCKWRVNIPGPLDKLVNIQGEMRVEPDGDAASVIREKGQVGITAPIIGKAVEKAIVADIKSDFPKKTKYFQDKMG